MCSLNARPLASSIPILQGKGIKLFHLNNYYPRSLISSPPVSGNPILHGKVSISFSAQMYCVAVRTGATVKAGTSSFGPLALSEGHRATVLTASVASPPSQLRWCGDALPSTAATCPMAAHRCTGPRHTTSRVPYAPSSPRAPPSTPQTTRASPRSYYLVV